MNISAGAVYASTCPESPLQGFHRVIQLLRGAAGAVV